MAFKVVIKTHGNGYFICTGYIGENNAINGSIKDERFYHNAL